MKKIYSSYAMKQVDNYSIYSLNIPSLALMERAAACVADEVSKYHNKEERILAICGIGNNGADGLATVRILHSLGYVNVSAMQVGSDNKATEEYLLQKSILSNMSIPVYEYEDINSQMNKCDNEVTNNSQLNKCDNEVTNNSQLNKCDNEVTNNSQLDKQHIDLSSYDVIVDGIFGIGLTREVTGIYRSVIEEICNTKACVYAIDIPSGVDGNTGKILGVAVKANKTITFGANKLGNVLYPGVQYAGDVVVCNIGFPKMAYENCTYYSILEPTDIKALIPKRKAYSNKGTYGKLLIVAGNENMYGAAYLCSAAAFAMGVGLVKIITSKNNKKMLNDKLVEAIVISYDNTSDECGNSIDSIDSIDNINNINNIDNLNCIVEDELNWCDTILIGPGLGVSDRTYSLLDKCIATNKSIIIDADGLNTISAYPKLKDKLHNKTIITPHLGEASRLTGKSIADISSDILNVCEDMSKMFNVSCVLKDARTVIVNTKGERYINLSGNSGMAKAGSGDVLSGIIAGLVATGADTDTAAILGPYIHGRAGDIVRSIKGEYSMMPSDIIETIPKVIE